MIPDSAPKPQQKLTANISPKKLRRARLIAAARNTTMSRLLLTLLDEEFGRLPLAIQALEVNITDPQSDILTPAPPPTAVSPTSPEV